MKRRIVYSILWVLFGCLLISVFNTAIADTAPTFGDYDLVNQQGYNLTLLKSLGELAIAEAYEQEKPEITKNGFRTTLPFSYGDIDVFDFYISDAGRRRLSFLPLEDQAWECEGTVSFKEIEGKGGIILICFEGSNAVSDWINNLLFLSGDDGIHYGFGKAARLFLDDYAELLVKRYNEYIETLGGCQIVLTGHSLGGATAQVATYWLHQEYQIPKDDLLTYTYASPNPFSKALQTGTWNNVFNLHNPRDVIKELGADVFGQSIGLANSIPDTYVASYIDVGKNHTDVYLEYLRSITEPPRLDAAPQEEAAENQMSIASQYRELASGMKGDDVRRVQQKLSELGYLNDKIDGKYGKKTAAAVRKYQKAQGFTETGVLTQSQQAALLGDVENSNTISDTNYNPEQYPLFGVYSVQKDEIGIFVTGSFGNEWLELNKREGIIIPKSVGFDKAKMVSFHLSDDCVPEMIDLYSDNLEPKPCEDFFAWYTGNYAGHSNEYMLFSAAIILNERNEIDSLVQHYSPND